MVRQDKADKVKQLEELFSSANALVLAEYRGLTVTQQTKLRSCLLYTSPSPRDQRGSRMPSSA